MSRTAIFIDGAYLGFGLREFGEPKIDFTKLAHELSPDREVLRTYYYHCLPWQSKTPTPDEREQFGRMQAFINCLNKLPRFEVRLGKLAHRGVKDNGSPIFVQKRVDIMLGVDLVQLSAKGQICDAVLIAGDSDFLPAVTAARNEGVLLHLWHFQSYHRELWDACDERHVFDQDFIDRLTL
jgi:uncharacterized LabA/DUF88 family protein